ncbi:MAG: protein-glutamate O-methyltransferase CheR, partial [Pseudohongiellaceae bacterium]
MNQQKHTSAELDWYTLDEQEFQFICHLVHDATGIVLDERKREMLYRRLRKRIKEVGVQSFSEYCLLLKDSKGDELPNFINSITTNLTSFFREPHHFEYLKEQLIPSLLEKSRREQDTKKLRIWSSACSTGEEAYSVAISVHQAFKHEIEGWDVKILATDLDSDVVETAKRGIYNSDRLKDLDQKLISNWFQHKDDGSKSLVKAKSMVRELITFKQLNLLERWPIKGPFDAIFCRNVLIYFDKATQAQLIPRYFDLLKPGGILFLCHSESIAKGVSDFVFCGKTSFK